MLVRFNLGLLCFLFFSIFKLVVTCSFHTWFRALVGLLYSIRGLHYSVFRC
ncbi:hypothetical protein ACSBR1_009154 [Camellia fascicularis]